ncbi:MAG: tryptophan--tRNA ligase [Deltaproteobacteria bacterium]|nr:tryptophan--tRNA ligase [Deltaproteobacteria bacterium]
MPRHLSGIQPSGLPHIGNYFGAIAQHVEVSMTADPAAKDALFFIADLHALTSLHERAELEQHVRSIAASYLALGLDAERAVFFRQSDVPEVTELMWLLMTVTGMGLLERAHSYKDKTARGLHANVGLFTYPVLMAADIVIYDADVVPVGHDQIQHVEMTQDMVTHFNTAFGGEFLRRPEWRLSPTPKVPGKDGAKMSKSYGNDIWIFEEGKALKKSVNGIVTDSRPPEEPKDPDGITSYAILELFLDEAERADWRARITKGGVGYGHLKGAIIEKMDARFGEARHVYRELLESEAGMRRLEETLARGASLARPMAQTTLARCFDAVGMGNAARRLRR